MSELDEIAVRRCGQVLRGRWKLERLLGMGGMAAVYAASDPSGQMFAIKMLHPEMSIRADVRDRFLREGYVANSIDHPGVVRVLGHDTDGDGAAFLVMELLQGQPLDVMADLSGSISVSEILDFADQTLDVLAVAHAQGVIHRDLKPENLFITSEGRLKVLDFGIARTAEQLPTAMRTRTGMALGTLPYMAPEQALGRQRSIDGRTDLFSLGATMFRLLSGRKVHEADSEAELLIAMASQHATPLALAAPNVPLDVCMVVDRALTYAQDARYPDARTMQNDVRALRNGDRPAFALSRLTAPMGAAAAVLAPTAPASNPPSAPVSGRQPASGRAVASAHASTLVDRQTDGTRIEGVARTMPDVSQRAVAATAPMTAPGAQASKQSLTKVMAAVALVVGAGFLLMLAVGVVVVALLVAKDDSAAANDDPPAGSAVTAADATAPATGRTAPTRTAGGPPVATVPTAGRKPPTTTQPPPTTTYPVAPPTTLVLPVVPPPPTVGPGKSDDRDTPGSKDRDKRKKNKRDE